MRCVLVKLFKNLILFGLAKRLKYLFKILSTNPVNNLTCHSTVMFLKMDTFLKINKKKRGWQNRIWKHKHMLSLKTTLNINRDNFKSDTISLQTLLLFNICKASSSGSSMVYNSYFYILSLEEHCLFWFKVMVLLKVRRLYGMALKHF